MNERIKELRKTLGLTQQEFADALRLKRNTVATYEMGRSIPSDAAIALICQKFGVNETWLRTGEGEMLAGEKDKAIMEMLADVLADENQTFKARLIKALATMDKAGWASLEKLLDSIYKEK